MGEFFVRSGDTLYNIAKQFGTTVDAIIKANNLQTSSIYPGQRLIIPNSDLYYVKLGDTLYNIARRYGTTVDAIVKANNLQTSSIYPGQRLIIPNSDLYYVKSGDTLYNIAKRFGATVDAIIKANNLQTSSIYPGQELIIPISTLPDGVFKLGSRGDDVRAIQQALFNIGFALPVNGIYDVDTENIIKSIQKKYPESLKVDGIYGPNTKLAIQRLQNSGYRIVQDPSSLLVLANKTRALPHSYIPNNLVIPKVPAASGLVLRADAAKALEELFAKAKSDNISLYGVSGYRSYDRQATLFANNITRNPNANLTSARPGESEHQTGLSIDVSSPVSGYALTQAFGDTKEGKWLKENAPQFGFIVRFPKGKEAITGYAYEPWHIRYVGKDVAQKIASQNITLEEYLGS